MFPLYSLPQLSNVIYTFLKEKQNIATSQVMNYFYLTFNAAIPFNVLILLHMMCIMTIHVSLLMLIKKKSWWNPKKGEKYTWFYIQIPAIKTNLGRIKFLFMVNQYVYYANSPLDLKPYECLVHLHLHA